MSKNIFSVLANEDSDDESNTQLAKGNKKQQRKKDKFLRDTYGDSTGKVNNTRNQHQKSTRGRQGDR